LNIGKYNITFKYMTMVIVNACLLVLACIYYESLFIPFLFTPLIGVTGGFSYFFGEGQTEGMTFVADHWLWRWICFGRSIYGQSIEKQRLIREHDFNDLKTYRIPQAEYHRYPNRAGESIGIVILIYFGWQLGHEMTLAPTWWKLPYALIPTALTYPVYKWRLAKKWDTAAPYSDPYQPD